MVLSHVGRTQLAHGVDALQHPGADTVFIQIVAGLVDAGDGGEDLGFHIGVADVLILFVGAVFPRSHPGAQTKHVVQFCSGDNPLKAFHLIGVRRCVVADLVDGAFIAPCDFRDVLHFLDRQTAAGEVHVGVGHRVAVPHAVEHAAQLSVVFVGVMLRVTVGPIKRTVVVAPGLQRNTEVVEHDGRRFAEPLAEFAFAISDSREEILHCGGVHIVNLLPGQGVILFLGEEFLPVSVLIHDDHVALQLTVIAPEAQVVHELAADNRDFNVPFRMILQIRIEEDREEQAAAGLFSNRINVVLGGCRGIFNDRIAADRAGKAPVVANVTSPFAVA